MAKITSYTEDSAFTDGDVLLKDGDNGTRIIDVDNAAIDLAGRISSVNHRNIYRGASLGTSISSTQQTAISSGTFDGIYIGDYWTINSTKYVVADMDYYYKTGSSSSFTKHHLVMVPASIMYSAQMNSSNTTEGGYIGSEMYTTNLEDARTTISTDFGDLLLTHENYFVNAVTSGYSSAGAWYDSTVDLMNEIMVYGCYIRASMGNNGSTVPTSTTVDKMQLALFRLAPTMVNIRSNYWLRDVVSSTIFACVSTGGLAYNNSASASYGVRPAFVIGA